MHGVTIQANKLAGSLQSFFSELIEPSRFSISCDVGVPLLCIELFVPRP